MQTEIFFLFLQKFESQVCSLCKVKKRNTAAAVQTPLAQQCMPRNAVCYCIGQDQLFCHCHTSLSRILSVFVTVPCPASSATILQPAELSEDNEKSILLLAFLVFKRGDGDGCNQCTGNSICGNQNVEKHSLSGSHFIMEYLLCQPRC